MAPHPFTTTESSVAAAPLPDARLDALAAMSASRRWSTPGWRWSTSPGSCRGHRPGRVSATASWPASARSTPCAWFCGPSRAPRYPGDTDPVDALATLELELVLADVATIESQIDKRREAAKSDKSLAAEVAAMEAALEESVGGGPAVPGQASTADSAPLRESLFLLTDKPVLAVVNLGEDQLDRADGHRRPVADALGGHGEALGVCVQLEAETAQLPPSERAELLEGLGLGEGALTRVAQRAYHLLGRRIFLTTGDKESRAWSFRAGATAASAPV